MERLAEPRPLLSQLQPDLSLSRGKRLPLIPASQPPLPWTPRLRVAPQGLFSPCKGGAQFSLVTEPSGLSAAESRSGF